HRGGVHDTGGQRPVVAWARGGDPGGPLGFLGLAAGVRAARRADPDLGRVRGDVPRVHGDLPRIRGSEDVQGAGGGIGTGTEPSEGRDPVARREVWTGRGTEAS